MAARDAAAAVMAAVGRIRSMADDQRRRSRASSARSRAAGAATPGEIGPSKMEECPPSPPQPAQEEEAAPWVSETP